MFWRGMGSAAYMAGALLLAAFPGMRPRSVANVGGSGILSCALLGGQREPETTPGTQSDPSEARKVPVYISDFELFSARAPRANPKKATGTPPTGSSDKKSDLIYTDTDPASVQARRMIDAFSAMLVQQFQEKGYTVTRLTGSLPTSGVLLRGVFAEPDGQNRIRRAILGAGAPGPSFLLYVGTFNLAHQDQPLYLEAPVQSPDAHYGPVISLNAYIPLMKFEVAKDPEGADVQKICEQVVSQLTKLLGENPSAVQ